MENMKRVYGPVPSRRMGISVGVSPIPDSCCNYSCIYCQLGRTRRLTNERKEFFSVNEIIEEFKMFLSKKPYFDVVTLVGEGEPTLYLKLGELISEIKKLTDKPVAVITNGALLSDENLRNELMNADIVLPSIDANNEIVYKKINRPHGKIKFEDMFEGLVEFSKNYKGQLWLETMIVKDINDGRESLLKFKSLLDKISYDRLYINTPVRPPAESWVEPVSEEKIREAIEILDGISISTLCSEGFYSGIEDDYEAILSIIKRHPMNQHEIMGLLNSRNCENPEELLERLNQDDNIEKIDYKGYRTYRPINN